MFPISLQGVSEASQQPLIQGLDKFCIQAFSHKRRLPLCARDNEQTVKISVSSRIIIMWNFGLKA